MVAQLPLTKIKQLSQLDTKMAVRMNRNINTHIDISKQHERCLLSNMRQQRWPTIMHHTKNNADSPPSKGGGSYVSPFSRASASGSAHACLDPLARYTGKVLHGNTDNESSS